MSGVEGEARIVERLERLEGRVERLSGLVESMRGGSVEEAVPAVMEEREAPEEVPGPGLSEQFGRLSRPEWWLTRGGIFLLLLGVAFFFKLSVDEGWITPPVRVLIVMALGAGLIELGVRVRRVVTGRVLIGGGIAALYASGFTAYTLYELVPSAMAFPFMVFVTVVAFTLALTQNSVTLSVVATAGGLATPFLLYDGEGSQVGLVFYTCVVLAGATGVYLVRGWRMLLGLASTGTLLIFTLGTLTLWPDTDSGARTALFAGISVCFLASWGAPIVRAWWLRVESPGEPGLYMIPALTLPLYVVTLFGWVAEWTDDETNLLMLGVAGLYALVSLLLWRAAGFQDGRAVYGGLAASVLLSTISATTLLDGPLLAVAISLEAAFLGLVAVKRRDPLARVSSYGLWTVLAIWFTRDVVVEASKGFASHQSLGWYAAWLTAIAIAFLVSLRYEGTGASVHRVAAYAASLGWMMVAISPLPNGGVFTTVAWGVCGAALVLVSLRDGGSLALRIGVSTLVLVVGKLFIVDLFWVEPLWRVALFVGFGGLFLVLGYFLQPIWRPRDESSGGV